MTPPSLFIESLSRCMTDVGPLEILHRLRFVRAMLLNDFPTRHAEVDALIMAGQQGVIRDLESPVEGSSVHQIMVMAAKSLENDRGIRQDLADWSVGVWAVVLEKITLEELTSCLSKGGALARDRAPDENLVRGQGKSGVLTSEPRTGSKGEPISTSAPAVGALRPPTTGIMPGTDRTEGWSIPKVRSANEPSGNSPAVRVAETPVRRETLLIASTGAGPDALVLSFLVALGDDAVRSVMAKMAETDASLIREGTSRVPTMNDGARNVVLTEVSDRLRRMAPSSGLGLGGLKAALIAAYGSRAVDEALGNGESDRNIRPFAFLNPCTPAVVAKLVSSEQPQTVALIVGLIEPTLASCLLPLLPPNIQASVAVRSSMTVRGSPDIVRAVERRLRLRLMVANAAQLSGTNGGGSFEDLSHTGVENLSRVIAACDARTLAIAIAGSSTSTRERYIECMPPADAARMKREISMLGPQRQVAIKVAQDAVIAIAATVTKSS